MAIPRNIHQIFLTGYLPEVLETHVLELKERNPGWRHTIYNNDDAIRFIDEAYGKEMQNTYGMISEEYGAARADLLRHLLIFHHGGVYLDIKSNFRKPLDDVLREDDHYLLSQWDNGPGRPREGFGLHPELAGVPGGEYQTHAIIGEPGHPFSRAAIERITSNIRNYKPWSGVGKMGVVRTTGPSAYTLAIHPLRPTVKHRIVTEDEIGLEFSIPNYDHNTVFKKHYSKLSGPVARLSPMGRFVQHIIEAVRSFRSTSLARRKRG